MVLIPLSLQERQRVEGVSESVYECTGREPLALNMLGDVLYPFHAPTAPEGL